MSQTEDRTKGYSEKEINELFGAGKRFWNSDEDFEIWLEELREMRGHGKKDNGWIPGNEPEKDDFYQITITKEYCTEYQKDVKICFYWKGSTGWQAVPNISVIAYAPIKLKEPYKPPEPEREFEFNREYIEKEVSDYVYLWRNKITGTPTPSQNGEYLRKILERIYDKLNS